MKCAKFPESPRVYFNCLKNCVKSNIPNSQTTTKPLKLMYGILHCSLLSFPKYTTEFILIRSVSLARIKPLCLYIERCKFLFPRFVSFCSSSILAWRSFSRNYYLYYAIVLSVSVSDSRYVSISFVGILQTTNYKYIFYLKTPYWNRYYSGPPGVGNSNYLVYSNCKRVLSDIPVWFII